MSGPSKATKRKPAKKGPSKKLLEEKRSDPERGLSGDPTGLDGHKAYFKEGEEKDPWSCHASSYWALYFYGVLIAVVVAIAIVFSSAKLDIVWLMVIFGSVWGVAAIGAFVWYLQQAEPVTEAQIRILQAVFLAVLAGIIGGLVGSSPYSDYREYAEYQRYGGVAPEQPATNFPKAQYFQFQPDNVRVERRYTGVAVVPSRKATYCVAPILTKTSTPQSQVYYWAVGSNCCAGAFPTVTSTCANWASTYTEGRVLNMTLAENAGFETARAAIVQSVNGLVSSPNAFFIDLSVKDSFTDSQVRRKYFIVLFIGLCAMLWPFLLILTQIPNVIYLHCCATVK